MIVQEKIFECWKGIAMLILQAWKWFNKGGKGRERRGKRELGIADRGVQRTVQEGFQDLYRLRKANGVKA